MDRIYRFLVYPEGDTQEIGHRLNINQVIDINGNPLSFPLPTARLIAYRVVRISTRTKTGEQAVSYHLELVEPGELQDFVRPETGNV